MKLQRRYGWSEKQQKTIICVVTGVMSDGTKVWTECDSSRNLINIDKQYTLQTRNGWSEFIPL